MCARRASNIVRSFCVLAEIDVVVEAAKASAAAFLGGWRDVRPIQDRVDPQLAEVERTFVPGRQD